MKKMWKRLTAMMLALVLALVPVTVRADAKPYLSLGADLTPEQRATVLSLLEITEADVQNLDVAYVTNTEEHQYLDAYMGQQQIGSKSLSSVVVYQTAPGTGLTITAKNITYCTEGMYRNACQTAGLKDAKIIVAGPSPISGTAALVGIIKAYQNMTGAEITEDVIDGALNELIVTGDIEGALENVDPDVVEGMISQLKQEMVERDLNDAESIGEAVDEACKEYNVTLSDSERTQVINLVLKLSQLDLSAEQLTDLVQKAQSGAKVVDGIQNFFQKIGEAITGFFSKLFGG